MAEAKSASQYSLFRVLSILGSVLLVVGGLTIENTAIVYWTSAPISPFGVLLFANIWFVTTFGVIILAYAVRRRNWRVLLPSDDAAQNSLFTWGSLHQQLVLVGFTNILNGFLIVYASPPDRTPPLMQAVLQNGSILYSIPFSKWLLKDKKRYFDLYPLVAGGLVAVSILVSILPTLLAGASDGLTGKTLPWILIFALGPAPGALYNVIQQRYLVQVGALRPEASAEEITVGSLRVLWWGNFYQILSLMSFFWVDILPWFGATPNIADWRTNVAFSLSCSFAGPAGVIGGDPALCDVNPPHGESPARFAYAFMFGAVLYYIGGIVLNRESATFTLLASVVTTFACSTWWLIPGMNPNPTGTPIWSVAVAVLCSSTGLCMWKVWENRTPADEQFGLGVLDMGRGDGDAGAGGGDGDDDVEGNDYGLVGVPVKRTRVAAASAGLDKRLLE